MIFMGGLPFRVAFRNFTQRSRKCQLFLLFEHANLLCQDANVKSSALRDKTL